MTVEEIYSELAAHMIKGMMLHEQMANYYQFLGFDGYACCHDYHFRDESCNFRKLNEYFIKHHNKLIPEKEVDDPKVIPANWYRYSRQDVDTGTKKNAVKTGLTSWVNWERETKKLYENMYKELIDIDEVASAMLIKQFICDVDRELSKAEKYWLNKEAIGYDIGAMIAEQSHKKEKYEMKKRTM